MTGLKDCSEEEEFPDWVKGIQAEVSDVSFTCVPHNQGKEILVTQCKVIEIHQRLCFCLEQAEVQGKG